MKKAEKKLFINIKAKNLYMRIFPSSKNWYLNFKGVALSPHPKIKLRAHHCVILIQDDGKFWVGPPPFKPPTPLNPLFSLPPPWHWNWIVTQNKLRSFGVKFDVWSVLVWFTAVANLKSIQNKHVLLHMCATYSELPSNIIVWYHAITCITELIWLYHVDRMPLFLLLGSIVEPRLSGSGQGY